VVVIAKVLLVDPAATVTLAGTPADVSLVDSVTTAPLLPAGEVNVTVPVDPVPPATLAGLAETDDRAGTVAVAARGVRVRVAEPGRAVPTAWTPRTRQKRRVAGSPVAVSCETVTPCSSVSGALNVFDGAIWIT